MSTAKTETTGAKVRRYLAELPRGAKFYAASIKTPAGGATRWAAREDVAHVCQELREALRDPAVANMTVLVLYDEVAGTAPTFAQLGLGEGR